MGRQRWRQELRMQNSFSYVLDQLTLAPDETAT